MEWNGIRRSTSIISFTISLSLSFSLSCSLVLLPQRVRIGFMLNFWLESSVLSKTTPKVYVCVCVYVYVYHPSFICLLLAERGRGDILSLSYCCCKQQTQYSRGGMIYCLFFSFSVIAIGGHWQIVFKTFYFQILKPKLDFKNLQNIVVRCARGLKPRIYNGTKIKRDWKYRISF